MPRIFHIEVGFKCGTSACAVAEWNRIEKWILSILQYIHIGHWIVCETRSSILFDIFFYFAAAKKQKFIPLYFITSEKQWIICSAFACLFILKRSLFGLFYWLFAFCVLNKFSRAYCILNEYVSSSNRDFLQWNIHVNNLKNKNCTHRIPYVIAVLTWLCTLLTDFERCSKRTLFH